MPGFSKKLDNLKAAVALYFAWYNFVRIHGSLKVTPAMEAGITSHVWSLDELMLGDRPRIRRRTTFEHGSIAAG